MLTHKKICILLLLSLACFVFASKQIGNQPIGVTQTVQFFKTRSQTFSTSLHQLKQTIEALPAGNSGLKKAQQALAASRQAYKQIEFFVEYFFSPTSNIFNRPLGYEIEMPHIEYKEPIGLQVVEDLLFDKSALTRQQELLAQVDALITSAENSNAVLFTLTVTDEQILESLRLQLIRIATLTITGTDAPALKSGIREAATSLAAVQTILEPYVAQTSPELKDSLLFYFSRCRGLLANQDFNSFDRLGFLFNALIPLQNSVGALIDNLHLYLNTVPGINYRAANLFAPDFINKEVFTETKGDQPALMDLGKKLFFEKRLSQNSRTNCASCHAPEKYFTDGRKKSIGFNDVPLQRNAPTILYAVYQQTQFLDGREKTLSDQVKAVLLNSTEMTGHPQVVLDAISRDAGYPALFKKSFPDSAISFTTVAAAIAAYEATLTPFASPFDAFAQGNNKALTPQQKKGFNLFMGKAGCGTCHFAPLFNGLFPPYYRFTDLEIIGTPGNSNLAKPVMDKDSGQFYKVPLPFTIGAFKTPSVRNTARTGPYMHNGVFTTLNQVMDFYDKGGGQGLGLPIAYQTLSARPLKLTANEKAAVISFLRSLTDSILLLKNAN